MAIDCLCARFFLFSFPSSPPRPTYMHCVIFLRKIVGWWLVATAMNWIRITNESLYTQHTLTRRREMWIYHFVIAFNVLQTITTAITTDWATLFAGRSVSVGKQFEFSKEKNNIITSNVCSGQGSRWAKEWLKTTTTTTKTMCLSSLLP